MNRSILITAIITAVACGTTFLVRANKNSQLQNQIEEQSVLVSRLEGESGTGDAGRLTALPPKRDQTAEAIAEVRAATTTEQRIERAHERVNALISDLGNLNQSPDKLFSVLPDVLRVLKDLDIDELIAVTDKIDAPPSMGRNNNGKGIVKMILLLLAGEQEPVRILDKFKDGSPGEVVGMALGSLAQRDPKAAMSWLDGSGFSDSEQGELRKMVALKALNIDFDTGLLMLRNTTDLDSEHAIALFSQLPFDRKMLDQAAEALRRPENADLKPALVNMVLNTSLFHSGVEGARAAVARHELPKEDVAAFLQLAGSRFAQSDPAAMIGWMAEAQPIDVQQEVIPDIVKTWARRDYNAAGEFLGGMEPSPLRDLATVDFSKAVATLDPEAAAIWALEIQDAEQRQSTIQFVAGQWREKDQATADAWLAEKGITVE